MTGVVDRTLSDVADKPTVPQLRIPALLKSRGPMNLTTIAQHQPDTDDRRSAVLQLTDEGSRLLAEVMTARCRLIDRVILRMDPADERVLTQGLEAFTATVAAMPPKEFGLPDRRLAGVTLRPTVTRPEIGPERISPRSAGTSSVGLSNRSGLAATDAPSAAFAADPSMGAEGPTPRAWTAYRRCRR